MNGSKLLQLLALAFCLLASASPFAQTIYFEQDFSNLGTPFVGSPPNINQVDILYARPNTPSTYAIHPGYIAFIRSGPNEEAGTTGGSVHMMRHTPFSPVPQSMYYQVTINVVGSVMNARPAAYFYVGNNLEYLPNPKHLQENARVFSKFALYLNDNGSYQFRDVNQNNTSAPITGPTQVTWVMNNESSAFNYLSPLGTLEPLGAGRYDIWLNNSKWISNANRISSVPLANISFAFYNGSAEIQLSNYLIRDVNGILPLPIVDFQAKRQSEGVQLNWEMTKHLIFASYQIERSTDLLSWELIDEVPHKPNETHYQYHDINAPTATVYYRLHILSSTSTSFYSPVESILPVSEWQIAPNPVTDNVITLIGNTHSYQFMLYNALGVPLSIRTVHINNGTQLFIPSPHLPAGIYGLKAFKEGYSRTIKVVVVPSI